MADNNATELARREERLFGLKRNLDGLNQEIAYNFYPERADFTVERSLGTEFAIDIFDSAPILARRDLGNARAAMLRPRGSEWFLPQTPDDKLNKRADVAKFMQWLGSRTRAAMYQAKSGFTRAQKEADHDLVSFGNAVQTIEGERTKEGPVRLINRTWHLRDCVWLDDRDGIGQDFVARRFKASARHIKQKFPDADLHGDILQAIEKEPDKEFKLCHVMMLAEEYSYGGKKPRRRAKYVSVYYDSDNKTLLTERPSERFRYVIQRWATISGHQYALSPASIASLSDARGMQTMARVLLEAGEKSLDPPLKATQGTIKSAIDTGAGAITWVDKNYDEKLGLAIEPLLPADTKPAIGIELILRTTQSLKDAWYLTKLTLPQGAKTAYETAQLVEEFIRANIPLFEPWESDTELVLSETVSVLMDIGWYGPPNNWPQEMSGSDIEFQFSNPLQDAIKRNMVNQANTALGLLAGATKVDPNAAHAVDVVQMVSDAVKGSGAPAEWTPDIETAKANAATAAQPGNVLGALQTAGQAADVVNSGMDATQKLKDLITQPAADQQVAYGPT